MSIAWSTVAFLVLLLPGFLFFVGLYLPENFTRETAPRSPLGQLAATVLVAFSVHGVLYALSWSLDVSWIPHIRLDYLLQLLQVEALTDTEFAEIIANIESYRWWIVDYVWVSCVLGLGAGYETGCLIVHGPLRRLAEHAWVYDLKVEGGSERVPGLLLKLWALVRFFGRLPLKLRWLGQLADWVRSKLPPRGLRTITVAYVLTDVTHAQRYLMYRGFLKAFGISKDGKPLYLLLSNTMRSYMSVQEQTGTGEDWHLIGSTPGSSVGLPGPRLSSYLTVSGEHINNVVFDRHVFEETASGLRALETAYSESIASDAQPSGL